MSSHRTNRASPEASGEPAPGIVQNYTERLQALGYSPGLTGKCIRTILHLIAWLSANGTGIEALDVRVLHHFLNHDCACPGPRGYRKNLERARWHLHRFLGFLMETGRVRMPAQVESGARVVEAFLQTLMAQGYVHESIAAYRKRCRHFIVWLYLHDVALAEVDDDVFSRFLLHDCTCAHPHFFIRTGRFAGRNNSRSKIGLFIEYLIGTGIAPPRPTPACEEPGRYLARFLVWLRAIAASGSGPYRATTRPCGCFFPILAMCPVDTARRCSGIRCSAASRRHRANLSDARRQRFGCICASSRWTAFAGPGLSLRCRRFPARGSRHCPVICRATISNASSHRATGRRPRECGIAPSCCSSPGLPCVPAMSPIFG